MHVTVDIPENALREAKLPDIAVEALAEAPLGQVTGAFALPGFSRFGLGGKSPAEAAADIRELRKGQKLGHDVTIAELIAEGRHI